MTTIVATLDCMAADRFVTYGPSYLGDPKIWEARGSIWGAAGSTSLCILFKEWTLGKSKRPTFEAPEDDKIEVLQLSPKGLFLWINESGPDPVRESFYGIGSGGGYAVGALSKGATLDEAMEIAQKWDANTRGPFDKIALKRRGR
jgi:hypothetical protein